MAFKCGFFNAINGDRSYTAEQMNMPYKKIVSNGVFGDAESSIDLQVQATSGLTVIVKQGNGLFFDKWCENDADEPFVVPTPNVLQPRIDSIIIRVDITDEVRAGTIEYLTGTPSATPSIPTITNTAQRKEYRLANIYVAPNATAITQANITDTRPTNECGFISNLLWDSDITATYAQWQTQFDEWFNNLRLTLSTVTAITSFTSRYVATSSGETTIPIQIARFNSVLDILQVYINGIMLIQDVDYTVTDNTEIELLHAIDSGTPVSFIVYKSVDGTEAESVIDEINELYERMATSETNITKLFSLLPVNSTGGQNVTVPSSGNVLTSFSGLGVGFHTMFSSAGATNAPTNAVQYRYYGQLTGTTAGYLFALNNNGDVYVNNLLTTWQGWKPITTQAGPLWTGVYWMTNTQTVTPSKPLSACRNGWVLEWSGYESGSEIDNRIVTQTIPKLDVNGNILNSMLFYVVLPQTITTTQNTAVVCKAIYIKNTQITGHVANNVGPANGYVLRAVYEY